MNDPICIGIIVVRFGNGTYAAGFMGKRASSTSSAETAAQRVAEKALGHSRFKLERYGRADAFTVITEMDDEP